MNCQYGLWEVTLILEKGSLLFVTFRIAESKFVLLM